MKIEKTWRLIKGEKVIKDVNKFFKDNIKLKKGLFSARHLEDYKLTIIIIK
jgi:hypothetical protein